jgi:hypothetical protein
MPPSKPPVVIREDRPDLQRVVDALLVVLTSRPREAEHFEDSEMSTVIETALAARCPVRGHGQRPKEP